MWVFPFPWWEQSRVLGWLQGSELCWGTGAGGDQPELEEVMGRDELHPDVGIPVHEWGSDVHTIPVECWQLVGGV